MSGERPHKRDRWSDPACAAIRQELHDVLRDWLIDSNYRTRDHMAEFR